MQAYIFDFNGTLYPDKELHYLAWKQFMAGHGIAITYQIFEEHMYGPANDEIVRYFLGDDIPQPVVRRYSREKEAIYRQIAMDDPDSQALADGAPEMLDLMAARGIPHAIATASMPENVDFYFTTLGIGRWFDRAHVFFDEFGLPGKPDPAIYRLAMQRLGYDPSATTVVEDSMSGIRAAAGAGVGRIIAIDTTLGPKAFAGMPEVFAVIHDFNGFERFFKTENEN